MTVRRLLERDVEGVARRVHDGLVRDARRTPLVSADFDRDAFSKALRDAREHVWVNEVDGALTGHLYGAILESAGHGRGAWTGPDGASFDDGPTLSALYAAAGQAWIDDGALEHYVWVYDDPAQTSPWHELGFARMHARGVLELLSRPSRPLRTPYTLRHGGPRDLDAALALDDALSDAQRRGPSFSLLEHGPERRDELLDTLEDDEVRHYLVERDGFAVAQCITFPLEARRGSFDNTIHVSAVSVRPADQHLGVAQALIDHALEDARLAGFRYAETNWRVTNHQAAHFWSRYGFALTYVRLHRTIGRA